jgi:hypothetical protein
VLYRYFNPLSFFCLFYFLFFLIEQVFYLCNGFEILGSEAFRGKDLHEIYTRTQVALVAFLCGVAVGSFPFCLPLWRTKPVDTEELLGASETRVGRGGVWLFFAIGIAATIYLGRTLAASDDAMRSQLVKTTGGKLATALAFFGNFAAAVLVYMQARDRRYLRALAITAVFGAAVLYTGARGRFLWPVSFAVIMVFSARNMFPAKKVLAFCLAALAILAVMDPLKKALTDRDATFTGADVQTTFETFLDKRNFDGFANFALIYGRADITPDLKYARGIRDVFMTTYFYEVYESGVAYGSTFPGYFYLVGGLPALLALSVVFGALLGALNLALRRLRNRWLVTSYLFGIVWLAAVGGDFVESLGKLAVAVAPGPILLVVERLAYGRTRA